MIFNRIIRNCFIILIFLIPVFTIFSQTDTRYDADKNLPFNEKSGDVNPQTGNLILQYNDVNLPGRAGMDFSFTRIWSLNQSNVYNMYLDTGTHQNELSSDTIERMNRLGVGWSSNIPVIVEDTKSEELIKNLFFNGNVFQIDFQALSFKNGPTGNETKSNLLGYDLLDYRIYQDTSISYEDFKGDSLPAGYDLSDSSVDTNYYVLILKDNARYYFRPDGNLMMRQDMTGLNRIWYFYEKDPLTTGNRLRLVVDAIEREIRFSYNDDGYISGIEWDVTLGIKNGETRDLVTETRGVSYSYSGLESFPEIQRIKQLLYIDDRNNSCLLQSVTDPMGHLTQYDYSEGVASFTFNSNKPVYENVYLLLLSVSSFYNVFEDTYKNKRCFEYEIPVKGLYTKYFYNGFMEYYKISRQYIYDKNKRLCEDTRYIYHEEGVNGSTNRYSTVIEKENKTKRYYYLLSDIKSLQHVLQSLVTETKDGFLERKDFLYDENRAKVQEDLYRNGKWVYRETYSYDKKRNLRRYEDKLGLVTYRKYHETFSIPVLEIKTVSVEGEKKDYTTEFELNDNTGQVEAVHQYYTGRIYPGVGDKWEESVRTTLFSYDKYGNQLTVTDPLGITMHTDYDNSFHAFPVKVWQDVTIADWEGSHTASDNWIESPDASKKVRIRSWKTYNSDGSLWLEADNEGYAVEHYYNKLGDEIETVKQGSDDIVDFAVPLPVDEYGNPMGVDFNEFLSDYLGLPGDDSFVNYFMLRQNNAGVRKFIDYPRESVRTEIDIDKSSGAIKTTEIVCDGLGNITCDSEYASMGEQYKKIMVFDTLGRMIALTDPDKGNYIGEYNLHHTSFDRYERTWLVEYDDMDRPKKIIYPETEDGVMSVKSYAYDDVVNSVEIKDPVGRIVKERKDWNGNIIEIVNYGDNTTSSEEYQYYYYKYDELNRKISFLDAMGMETRYIYDERSLLIEQDYGNGSDFLYYDAKGQVIAKKDRKNQYVLFKYDELGRNIKSDHYLSLDDLHGGKFHYYVDTVFDNRGNAVRIENPNLIEHYRYDYANRIITLDRYLRNQSLRSDIAEVWGGSEADQIFNFSYTYNDAGMITAMVYPDASIHRFEYDDILARLRTLKNENENFVENIDYNDAGAVTKIEYANNTYQTWVFDNRKRIQQIEIGTDTGDIHARLDYKINMSGDVVQINDNEYTYDGLDRIIYAKTLIPGNTDKKKLVWKHFGTYSQGSPFELDGVAKEYNVLADLNEDGRVNGIDDIEASFISEEDIYDIESFAYDKNGNRTLLVQNGDEYSYTYGMRNRLEKVEKKKAGEKTKVDFITYEYDANGNTEKRVIYEDNGTDVREVIIFSYDVLNRLIKTVKTCSDGEIVCEYFYDSKGNRFIKKGPAGTTVYLRHGQVAIAMDIEVGYQGEEYKAKINRYVLTGDLLAGRITTIVNIDDSREVEKSYYHLDHLNSTKCVTTEDGSLDVMYEYRAFGEELKKIGNGDAKYTYSGKELDNITNLYYFNARYYDATIGRFINVDPVQDGNNWYVYVRNNPLCFADPTGLWKNEIHYGSEKYGGTLEWAQDIGFSQEQAEIIAQACTDVDKGATGPMPWQDPSRHFNTNWRKAGAGTSGDSRVQHAERYLQRAIEYQNRANELREQINTAENMSDEEKTELMREADIAEEYALKNLGTGLHSLQDVSAHVEEAIDKIDRAVLGIHHHILNMWCDDPEKNTEGYNQVQEDTREYLERFRTETGQNKEE